MIGIDQMEPLTRSQQALRGRKIVDMDDAQLADWIDACNKMEIWVKPAKARRSWKQGRLAAVTELERRRRHLGLCVACGYNLTGTPGACPECGQERG